MRSRSVLSAGQILGKPFIKDAAQAHCHTGTGLGAFIQLKLNSNITAQKKI